MRISPPRRTPARPQKPPRLRSGDTILFIAPASPPLENDLIERAHAAFSNRGFNVQIAKHAGDKHGFIAGTDARRLADLNRALRSRSARAIIAIRGGYGCGRIVASADFSAMQERPKILVGNSDITTLHCANILHGRTISFHGPMPQGLLSPECPDFTWNHLLKVLTGDPAALGSIATGYQHGDETIEGLRRGRTTAPLVGGNLAVLTSLIGTKFFPSLKDRIFFFEDIGETPFRIDRHLTQLLNTGILQSAAGFALGQFKHCSYRPPKPGEPIEFRQTLRDVILDRIVPLGKPVVLGLPFGHEPHNATLPIGGLATVDGRNGTLEIEELCVT